MDKRIQQLQTMLTATAEVLGAVEDDHRRLPTPCAEFDVAELCQHVAVWIQVFDSTINGTELGFDPSTERIDDGWQSIVATSGESIVAGLKDRGHERMMTMTGAELPGEMVLNMMLMEYIGHAWDVTQACGLEWSFSEESAVAGLAAAEAIVQPEHRGSPMFGEQVDVAADAPAIDRFVAFIGRDPNWRSRCQV